MNPFFEAITITITGFSFWSCLFLLTFYIAILSIILKCLQISAARIWVFKIQYPKACFFLTCLFGGFILVRAGGVLYKNISALFASLPTCHNWAVPGRLNQTSISDYFLFCIHTQPMGPSLLSTVREAGLRGPLQMDSQGSPEWEALGELEPASGQRLGGGGRMEDDAQLINQREHKKRKINQIWQLGELKERRIEEVAKSNYNIGNRMFDMKKELLDKLELKFNEDGAFKGARLPHLLDEYFDSKKKGYTDRYYLKTYSEWCRALDNPNSDFYNKMEAHLNKERSIDASNRAQSPLDQFSIVPFYPLQIGKFYCSFTNASFFLLLTLLFVLFYFHLVTKKGGGKLVPNAFQSVLELIYDFVPNLVNEQIGGLSGNVKQQFFPCISVTFTFSLFRNLQGMIPYSFTVTSHFIVTLGLSFSLFIGITIVGFVKNGLHFLSFSLPAGVPLPLAPFLVLLELIPHCFRALSLGIRLFANMMAGHSLVKILSGFAWTMLCMNDLFYFIGSTGPFFIVLALTGLELGVAILQAYVFTILICIYLNDAINLH